MSLIQCPECGGKVSDAAEICIHCGYPLSKKKEEIVETPLEEHTQNSSEGKVETGSGKKSHNIVPIAIISVAVIAAILSLCVACMGLLSTQPKNYVKTVTAHYKTLLLRPDSLTLRGDAEYIEDNDGNILVAFTALAENKYGTVMKDYVMYYNGTYIARYGTEPTEDMSEREKEILLTCNEMVRAGLHGEDMVSQGEWSKYERINLQEIAKKIGCEYEN